MPGDGENQLFDRVKRTDPGRLARGVDKAEHLKPALTPRQEQGLDRHGKVKLRNQWREFLGRLLWLLLISAVGFVVAIAVLTVAYLDEAISSGDTGRVLGSLLDFAFGVAATIAVEAAIVRVKADRG